MTQILLHGLNVIPTFDRSHCICVTKIVEPNFRMYKSFLILTFLLISLVIFATQP